MEGGVVLEGHRRDFKRLNSEEQSWWVSLVGYRLIFTEKPCRYDNQYSTANGSIDSSGRA